VDEQCGEMVFLAAENVCERFRSLPLNEANPRMIFPTSSSTKRHKLVKTLDQTRVRGTSTGLMRGAHCDPTQDPTVDSRHETVSWVCRKTQRIPRLFQRLEKYALRSVERKTGRRPYFTYEGARRQRGVAHERPQNRPKSPPRSFVARFWFVLASGTPLQPGGTVSRIQLQARWRTAHLYSC